MKLSIAAAGLPIHTTHSGRKSAIARASSRAQRAVYSGEARDVVSARGYAWCARVWLRPSEGARRAQGLCDRDVCRAPGQPLTRVPGTANVVAGFSGGIILWGICIGKCGPRDPDKSALLPASKRTIRRFCSRRLHVRQHPNRVRTRRERFLYEGEPGAGNRGDEVPVKRSARSETRCESSRCRRARPVVPPAGSADSSSERTDVSRP